MGGQPSPAKTIVVANSTKCIVFCGSQGYKHIPVWFLDNETSEVHPTMVLGMEDPVVHLDAHLTTTSTVLVVATSNNGEAYCWRISGACGTFSAALVIRAQVERQRKTMTARHELEGNIIAAKFEDPCTVLVVVEYSIRTV